MTYARFSFVPRLTQATRQLSIRSTLCLSASAKANLLSSLELSWEGDRDRGTGTAIEREGQGQWQRSRRVFYWLAAFVLRRFLCVCVAISPSVLMNNAFTIKPVSAVRILPGRRRRGRRSRGKAGAKQPKLDLTFISFAFSSCICPVVVLLVVVVVVILGTLVVVSVAVVVIIIPIVAAAVLCCLTCATEKVL